MQGLQLFRLMLHILREGKLKHSGHDFASERRKAFEKLGQFAPSADDGSSLSERVQHPVFRTLRAEASFVKSALTSEGGHLNLGHTTLSYVRIPKAGSTAIIRQMLLSQFPELRELSLTANEVNHLAGIHLKRQLTPADRNNRFFTIVRNPFARLVSVYRAYFEDAIGPFLYEDYLFGILRREMTFREFVATVDRIPDWLKDQHLKPQHHFVKYYERQGVDVKVMKLEAPKDIEAFTAKFGIAFEVFNASHNSYDYRTYYDAELVRTVGRIYRKDISALGYKSECM